MTEKEPLGTQSQVPLEKGKQKDQVFAFTSANYFAYSDSMISILKRSKPPVFLIKGKEDPMGESTALEIK